MFDKFANGTNAISTTLASLSAKGCCTIIGCGDSVAADEEAARGPADDDAERVAAEEEAARIQAEQEEVTDVEENSTEVTSQNQSDLEERVKVLEERIELLIENLRKRSILKL